MARSLSERAMSGMTRSERREFQRQFDMTGVRLDSSEYSNRRTISGQG